MALDKVACEAILAEKNRVNWKEEISSLSSLGHKFSSAVGARSQTDKARDFVKFMAQGEHQNLGYGWSRVSREVAGQTAHLEVLTDEKSGRVIGARGAKPDTADFNAKEMDGEVIQRSNTPQTPLTPLTPVPTLTVSEVLTNTKDSQVPSKSEEASPKPEAATSLSTLPTIPPKRKRRPGLKINIEPERDWRSIVPVKLPSDLKGKSLGMSNQLDKGNNGMVFGITVNGMQCNDYAIKLAASEGFRPTKAAGGELVEKFKKEIDFNNELAQLKDLGKLHDSIITSCGVADISGQMCMLMPRINGGRLASRIDKLYDAVIARELAPAQFVDQMAGLLRGPLEGMAAMHANGLVVNDFNAGSLLYEAAKDRAVVIDFGMSGHVGDRVPAGTIGTSAPERLSSNHGSRSPSISSVRTSGEEERAAMPNSGSGSWSSGLLLNTHGGSRLSVASFASSASSHLSATSESDVLYPSADAYAFGSVMYQLVHQTFPKWSKESPKAYNDAALFELGTLGADGFRDRGTIFPNGAPTGEDLRSADHACELDLREELKHRGFYSVIEGLMHPEADKRISLQAALESPFFQKTSVGA